jgi:hypothetical protein
MNTTDVAIDVTDAAGLDEPAHVFARVLSGRGASDRPVIVFARPGAGFTQGYFTHRLPGQECSQADWHAAQGWTFVALDHLGIGDSSRHDPSVLTYGRLARTAAAADSEILSRLAAGTLDPQLGPLTNPVVIGMGQSMGACLSVVQQAYHHSWDAIAVLGFSVVHTDLPVPAGEQPGVLPWILRDSEPGVAPIILNEPELAAAEAILPKGLDHPLIKWHDWHFYGDEVDPSTFRDSDCWTSDVYPAMVSSVPTPGVIAAEAAAVRGPVLVGIGERDVVSDIRLEAPAYRSATSIDLFECPRMAHMHNFAPTAALLWHRIHRWGEWVRDLCGYATYPSA